MSDTARKRAYVADLYPGNGWKRRVERMPDHQVTAIFLKHQDHAELPTHTDAQERLHDVEPRNPHWNEDEFETY